MANKSRTALTTQATTTLADNTTGLITPVILRTMVQDIIDSSSNIISDGTITTYVTQTGNYTLSDYTATDGVCQDWVITGNSTNTLGVPTTMVNGLSKWQNGNGNTLDNTKINYVFTCAKNGYIFYNIIKQDLPDIVAPTFTSNVVNAIGSTVGTYSVQLNESATIKWIVTSSATLPTKSEIDAGTGRVGTNSGSLTMTGSSSNTAAISGLTVSTTYYLYSYAIDLNNNQTSIQTITFATSAVSIVAFEDFSAPFTSNIAGRTTPTGGFAWVKLSSNSSSVHVGNLSGYAAITTPAGVNSHYGFNAGKRNVDVTFKVANPGASGVTHFNVAMVDDNNRIFVGGNYSVGTVIGGVFTTIYAGLTTWAVNDVVRVVVTTSTVTLFKNGTQLYTGTMGASITGQMVGFSIYADSCGYDDITVY